MKRNLRKIISLVLVLAMSLAISVPAFAATKDSGKGTSTKNSVNTKAVDKIGNATYYYESTDQYRICIGSYPSGLLDIAYIDKSNPDTLYAGNINTDLSADGSSITTKSSDSSIDFEKIKSNIIMKSIPLKETSMKKFIDKTSSLKSNLYRSGTSDAQIIGNALEKKYGKQYSNKLLSSLSQNGKYAKLYQALYFNIYDAAIQDFSIEVATTLATAAITLSLPATAVKALLSNAFKLINGEYKTSRSVGVTKYYAEVVYYKDVRINNDSPYRASREIDFTPYVCSSENSIILNQTKDYANDDFYDNVLLLQKGIELS